MWNSRSVRASLALAATWLLPTPFLAAPGETAAAPLGIVAVQLAKPDFLWRDVSTRVLVEITETRRVPLSGFDMATALGTACAQELGESGSRNWRTATAAELPAMAPYFAGKPAVLPAENGADRVLALYVVEYGALKVFVESGRKFFLNATALLFDPRSGKELWRRGYIEKLDVNGKFEYLAANGEQGLKQATDRLIAQFCDKVRARVESER